VINLICGCGGLTMSDEELARLCDAAALIPIAAGIISLLIVLVGVSHVYGLL